ncbi:hypothetical protein [Heterosigma akashiwo virus 01]|uniref:Protein kinase domain-containing protein n=1 Tax=Heterosigma akashiwo virus 01 TaxID=97195 RepID=A0A1C9C516_HAV01|nr:hypothetical protein D1R72_gp049 [Heterosigma akashiwo virus 01]AOM63380.1 hypothetical protein [Heterosigma akashiwo virus 01]
MLKKKFVKFKNCKIFIYNEKKKDKLFQYLDEIFKKALKKVGAESSNAYAMIVDGYVNKKYIVKIPRKNNGKVDSLLYEYITGMDIRKNILNEIPNFNKVYGYMSMEYPLDMIKTNVTNKSPKEFIILERIFSGKTLYDLFDEYSGCKIEDTPVIKSIIMQVMAALQYAQENIEFVHYDLHLNNIIIDDCYYNKKFIEYKLKKAGNNKKIRIHVIDNIVPIIIDFGRSRTKRSSEFLKKFTDLYKTSYKFLESHKIDIRKFDKMCDVKRFCTITKKYFPDFDINLNKVKCPYDVILYFKNNEFKDSCI